MKKHFSMETSTPVIASSNRTGAHRASFSLQNGPQLSPLKRNRPNMTSGLLNESNDDNERAERKRSVALRRSILALRSAEGGSPSLNDSVRVLSDEDLRTQLQTFCKLHADNKISSRNAWTLRVIDVLKQIVNKNNPDVLKVAGSSLEIAGKVYGLRVDDMHAEGLKLAGNLARNFANKGQGIEENQENQDPNATGDENQRKKRQSKKKKVLLSTDKKHTINADPKTFLGMLPKLESAAFSARTDITLSATGNLFTNKVRMDPAGYKFMFASNEKTWSWTPGNDASAKADTNKKLPISTMSVQNSKLCAPFKDFRVDMWDPDEEKKELHGKSNNLEDVVLDDNGIPIPELDGSVHDVFEERDHDDLNDDYPVEEEIIAPLIRQDVEHIVDFRPSEEGQVSAIEKSAYSFNNVINTCSGKIDQIWAGPSHWKLKFIRRSQMVYSGQDKNENKDQDRNKRKVGKKKNEPAPLDLFDDIPIDLTKCTKKPYKKKNYMLDAQKVTVPILESSCIKLINNKEYLMSIPTMKPVKKKTQAEMEYCVSDYNYNNPNDSNYCPNPLGNDDNDADLGDDIFDNDDNHPGTPNSQEGDASDFIGNNLVDAPQMVQQTYMHYAVRAKKMDMKKLKHAVWCTLTRTVEFDPSAKVTPTLFSEMYKELPKMLTQKMNAELSCPIAFVALLHLCNEQNLALKQQSDIGDFGILGPRSK